LAIGLYNIACATVQAATNRDTARHDRTVFSGLAGGVNWMQLAYVEDNCVSN